jgi:hypothetical protein
MIEQLNDAAKDIRQHYDDNLKERICNELEKGEQKW